MADNIWLKRVLVPLWILQLLVCIIYAAASALALYVADNGDFSQIDKDTGDNVQQALNVGAAILMALSIFTIVLDFIEMILVGCHTLKPVANIVLQSIKSLIWTVIFILEVRSAVVDNLGGLALLWPVVIFLTCMGQLIYGAVILHRHRKGTLARGKYSPAGNGHFEEAPMAGGYAPYNPGAAMPAGYSAPQNTAYKPQGAAGGYYGGQPGYEMHGTAQRYG